MKKDQTQRAAMPDQREDSLCSPSAQERSNTLALDYEAAYAALEEEEPVAVAVATEFILDYSSRAGDLLKEGKDYLDLLTPAKDTPPIERIAMELVLETLEEELEEEE